LRLVRHVPSRVMVRLTRLVPVRASIPAANMLKL
jgi:hypothetical protein